MVLAAPSEQCLLVTCLIISLRQFVKTTIKMGYDYCNLANFTSPVMIKCGGRNLTLSMCQ